MGTRSDHTQYDTVMSAGVPSPHPTQTSQQLSAGNKRQERPSPKDIIIVTMNVNSWHPFRDRWTAEGEPKESTAASVLLLQEHQLATREACRSAEEWCERRGWNAVFREAATLPSGRSSGGVAILSTSRPDIGVTDPSLPPEGLEHRLLGLRLKLPGLEPFLVVSAYLQAGAGMGQYNRDVLATIARWQEEAKLPILIGGDFNVPPALVVGSAFTTRSSTQVFSPNVSTYRTAKARTTIDYFIVSRCLSNKIHGCNVLEGFPLKPHLPVSVAFRVGQLEWVPVLDMPPKLPTEVPFGPRREPLDWRELAGRVEEAHAYVTNYSGSQWESVQALDQVYSDFVVAFEEQICQLTDVPKRQRSGRGRPPRIRWVEGSRRAKGQFKSWQTLDRPLVWVTQWVQHVLRYIAGIETDTSAAFLAMDLEEAPAEFESIPGLIGIQQRARILIKAMEMDERSQFSCGDLNAAAFQHFLAEVGEALEEERRHLRGCYAQSWRDWVKEAGEAHKGWAHRWSKHQEHWRPVKVSANGHFTGRPRDSLQQEKRRLSEVWRCSEEPQPWFCDDTGSYNDLPEIEIQEFLKAARSFPRRTASTWDGFHPRHYGMLTEEQAAVAIELVRLVERIGILPSVLQAIVVKLIPKHKQDATELSCRGIGLHPSLYRQWARTRRGEARRWEVSNKNSMLGHQSGRSIMEVVFLQALQSESGAFERQHTGCFLWDLKIFMNLSREASCGRGRRREDSMLRF